MGDNFIRNSLILFNLIFFPDIKRLYCRRIAEIPRSDFFEKIKNGKREFRSSSRALPLSPEILKFPAESRRRYIISRGLHGWHLQWVHVPRSWGQGGIGEIHMRVSTCLIFRRTLRLWSSLDLRWNLFSRISARALPVSRRSLRTHTQKVIIFPAGLSSLNILDFSLYRESWSLGSILEIVSSCDRFLMPLVEFGRFFS